MSAIETVFYSIGFIASGLCASNMMITSILGFTPNNRTLSTTNRIIRIFIFCLFAVISFRLGYALLLEFLK